MVRSFRTFVVIAAIGFAAEAQAQSTPCYTAAACAQIRTQTELRARQPAGARSSEVAAASDVNRPLKHGFFRAGSVQMKRLWFEIETNRSDDRMVRRGRIRSGRYQ
jgi:hypothetical protein